MLLFALFVLLVHHVHCKQLSPVILVNGDGGCRMESKLNKSLLDSFCDKYTEDYYTIWVKLTGLLPFAIDCLVDNFRLIYNNKTHTTRSPDGVDIRVPNFGDTDTVEWLSHLHYSPLGYYAKLVESMVTWGYVRNLNVRGAPYDFRKSPNELGDYYKELKKLIEDTFAMNNNTRVTFIAHSLGNLVILYFLQHQPQQWKDKYIQSFITLASPWGGSVKTMRMIASGDNIHVLSVKALTARAMQRTMTSSAFLMPSDKFWNATEVLLYTPKRNYTVTDYKQLFTDLKFYDGYLMRQDTANLLDHMTPPNVNVHCLYGVGLKTAKSFVYDVGQWPDKQPMPLYEDGDKTVNIRSLEGCLPWKHLQKQSFYVKTFQGIGHMDTIKHPNVINHIKTILM